MAARSLTRMLSAFTEMTDAIVFLGTSDISLACLYLLANVYVLLPILLKYANSTYRNTFILISLKIILHFYRERGYWLSSYRNKFDDKCAFRSFSKQL